MTIPDNIPGLSNPEGESYKQALEFRLLNPRPGDPSFEDMMEQVRWETREVELAVHAQAALRMQATGDDEAAIIVALSIEHSPTLARCLYELELQGNQSVQDFLARAIMREEQRDRALFLGDVLDQYRFIKANSEPEGGPELPSEEGPGSGGGSDREPRGPLLPESSAGAAAEPEEPVVEELPAADAEETKRHVGVSSSTAA